jgi:hypothetical protein
MKKITIFLLFSLWYCDSFSQIHFSKTLTANEVSLFKTLQHQLLSIPFQVSLRNNNDTSYTKPVFKIYDRVYSSVIDTTKITEALQDIEGFNPSATNQLQRMTLSNLIGIHDMVHCLPDSLFFIMPANEYASPEIDTTIPLPAFYKNLFLGGITSGGFYYPTHKFLLSEKRDRIYLIDFAINFETDHKSDKWQFYNKYIEPIITKCELKR